MLASLSVTRTSRSNKSEGNTVKTLVFTYVEPVGDTVTCSISRWPDEKGEKSGKIHIEPPDDEVIETRDFKLEENQGSLNERFFMERGDKLYVESTDHVRVLVFNWSPDQREFEYQDPSDNVDEG